MHSKKYFLSPDDVESKMKALVGVYNLAVPHETNAVEGFYDAASYQMLKHGDGTGIIFLRVSIGDVFVGFSQNGEQTFDDYSLTISHDIASILCFVEEIIPAGSAPEFILWRGPEDTIWNHDEQGNAESFKGLTDALFMSGEMVHDTVFDQFLYDYQGITPNEFTPETVKSEIP